MNAADDGMTDDEAAEAFMAALADLERDPLRERVAALEAALTRISHGEGRTATDLQRIAALALEGEK